MRGRKLPSWAGGAIGLAVLVIAWQIAGMTLYQRSGSVPPPTKVIHALAKDPSVYWDNLSATIGGAAQGWLWGNLLAIGLAFFVLVLPVFEKPATQVGVVSYCLPAVAIGPLFAIVFSASTARVVLAALAVFLTTLVGALVGLRSADPTMLDVVHAYGGGSVNKLTKVRLRASLPSLFAGLRIAAPAAVLGAIIGEYSGAEHGIGVAMIISQSRLDSSATWAYALVATAVAGVGYAITALVGRWLAPWAPRVEG